MYQAKEDRYLHGVPSDSRVAKANTSARDKLTPEVMEKLNALNHIAQERGQKLSQMALSLVLRNGKVTTVLIGASRPEQIIENTACIENLTFSLEELTAITKIITA